MKKSDLFFAFLRIPVDVVMIFVGFLFAYHLRVRLEVVPALSPGVGLSDYLRYSVYLMPIWIVLIALNGLYYIKDGKSAFREIYRVVNASSTAMIFFVLFIFLTKTLFFSRLILLFTWLASIITITIGRMIIRFTQNYLLRYGIGQKNVILIGDNQTSESVLLHLTDNHDLRHKVVGVLNGDSSVSKYGLKILGSMEELASKIKTYKIDEIVLTDTGISRIKTMSIIQVCADHNVVFKFIPDTFSLITNNVSTGEFGSMPVMELKPIPLDGWGRIAKRVIDFIFAILFLIILSPVFLIIAVLEKISSRGPVFYQHERIGRDEKAFVLYKFRSMYSDKCDYSKGGSKWTTEKDQATRITPLGRILRITNLDELPQLWNILKGEMSFVGPRPEQPRFVQKFEEEIPEYFRRHRVKAGLTGWAQVNGFKGDTPIRDRVRYDIYYIEQWSFWFDMKIIFETIVMIITEFFRGKYEYRSRS
jgi:exopolysaccharide biosynthesis polyprenyl glycosylphosphotransferase